MAILVELSEEQQTIWTDTVDVVWLNTSPLIWADSTGGSSLFLSINGQALDHYWDAYIYSFASPQYQTAKDYGGFVRMGFGNIEISPDAFASDWTPPKQLTINIKYTANTEGAAISLFVGDLYLDTYGKESITYTINDPKFTEKLLDVGTNYDGDTVPYPKAFGLVTHVAPLRLADDGSSQPCYHLGSILTTADAKAILSFSSAATGTKTTVTVDAAHGWSNGNNIIIAGSVHFEGEHVIESVAGATFVIPITYPTYNTEELPIHASAFLDGSFAVFDDGVPIQENVAINGDGTFSLTASPVGVVTMSGTGSETDLEGVITWGQQRLKSVSSIDTSVARGTSPSISYWATSQTPLIDFMSEICAFFTHYFYVEDDILTLGDMLLDNDTDTLDEFDYFDSSYNSPDAISQLKSSWTTHKAENGFVDEIRTARFIKEIKNTEVKSLLTLSSGTADGTSAGLLVDSGATFETDGVKKGHVAQNTTDDTTSVVTNVTETELTLEDNIFITGEDYLVGPSFSYGKEISITPYHDTRSNIAAALTNILTILNKDIAEIRLPITTTLPNPGKKLTFTDTQMIVDVSTYIRARNITFDFNSENLIITGEGITS